MIDVINMHRCFLHVNEYLILLLHLQFNKTWKTSKTKLALKKREKFKSIMFYSVEAAERTAFILLSFVRGVCYLLCLLCLSLF